MADDLVERLRAVQHGSDRPYAASVAADAAARIEALERELAEARKQAFEEAALIADIYLPKTFDSCAIAAAIRKKGEGE